MKKCFNKKLFLSIVLPIFLFGFLFIVSVPTSYADETDAVSAAADTPVTQTVGNLAAKGAATLFGGLLGIVCWVVGFLLYIVLVVMNKFVALGAQLAEFMLGWSSFTRNNIVVIGWGIIRSLCNMFFALALLIMAFATVLQIESYGAKKLLKNLIIAALLINFSLVIAGLFIDFAQIMTAYFINAASGQDLSKNLMNGMQIAGVYQIDAESPIMATLAGASAVADSAKKDILVIVTMLMGIIIFAGAAFAFFMFAFYLIHRLVKLWVYLIVSPGAWMGLVIPNVPGYGNLWSTWWSGFLKWTFFAPIYAFFVYLAVLIAKVGIRNGISAPAQGTAAVNTPFASKFFEAPEIILQYLVILFILIQGLKYAESAGAFGAKGAMKMVNSAGNWTKKKLVDQPMDWTKDSAKRLAAQGAAGVVGGVGLGNTRLGTRLRAKAVQLAEAPANKEQHKKYGTLLNSMSDKDVLTEMNSTRGIRKLLAVRKAKERGLLEKDYAKDLPPEPKRENFTGENADADYALAREGHSLEIARIKAENETARQTNAKNVREAMKVLSDYGAKDDKGKTKEQKDLEDVRFDVIEDKEVQANVIRRAKENGNLEKIKPVALRDPAAVTAMQEALDSPFDFSEVFKKWGKQTKKVAEEAMRSEFTDLGSITDSALLEKEVKKRQAYAMSTDSVKKAFADRSGELGSEASMNELKNYIQSLSVAQISNIKNPKTKAEDLGYIGRFATEQQFNDIRRERGISGQNKAFILAGAVAGNNEEARDWTRESNVGGQTVRRMAGQNRQADTRQQGEQGYGGEA